MKAVFPSTSVSVIIDDLYVLPPKCILLIIHIFQKEKTVNGFVISWLPCVCISTRSERLRRCFHPKWHGTGFHWWPFIYLGSVSSEPYLIFGGFNMHTVKPGSVMSFWSSFFHMHPTRYPYFFLSTKLTIQRRKMTQLISTLWNVLVKSNE